MIRRTDRVNTYPDSFIYYSVIDKDVTNTAARLDPYHPLSVDFD